MMEAILPDYTASTVSQTLPLHVPELTYVSFQRCHIVTSQAEAMNSIKQRVSGLRKSPHEGEPPLMEARFSVQVPTQSAHLVSLL
jgi:hypothetical protein